MFQFKHLSRNSFLLALSRNDSWGVILITFTKLAAFCHPIEERIYIIDPPLPFKTSKTHLTNWLTAIRSGNSIPRIALFQVAPVSPDELQKKFDDFLRLP
jgi:hypothetical protein